MYKVVAFWGSPKPPDVVEFEQYYCDTHVPLASKVPGMRRLVLTRTDAGLEGADPPFYRVAELLFDNPEALKAASESSQWHAMREDAGMMVARFGVTLQAAMGWEH
jgi:uncharacterized protein (TIGR02118 family)